MATTSPEQGSRAGLQIDLTGKVAFITGGGAGIGRGVALSLTSAGADIVIAEIEPQRGEETAELVRAAGGRALSVPTDVMETAQINAAVEAAEKEFGRLDILVNNAGGVRSKAFVEQSERSWRRHVEINFISTFAATSAAVAVMRKSGEGGSIINISSIEGTRAAPNFAVYAACKAGILNFTRTMALELADDKITVNAVTPDQTITPGNHGQRTGPVDESKFFWRDAEQQNAMERYIPLGREGNVADIGAAVAFLASPLGSYITGVSLPVDGGTYASSGWSRGIGGSWNLGEVPVSGTPDSMHNKSAAASEARAKGR
jgi:NAD(P)-dependent dehydrogenase (short-subunit alcohol dehydrogenase family)